MIKESVSLLLVQINARKKYGKLSQLQGILLKVLAMNERQCSAAGNYRGVEELVVEESNQRSPRISLWSIVNATDAFDDILKEYYIIGLTNIFH